MERQAGLKVRVVEIPGLSRHGGRQEVSENGSEEGSNQLELFHTSHRRDQETGDTGGSEVATVVYE